MLEFRYIEDMDWRRVAASMGASERKCREWHDSALDWVDGVGIARAKSGDGQPPLF